MKNFLTDQQQDERRKDIELYLSMKESSPNTSHEVAKVLIAWEGYQSRKTAIKMDKKLQRAEKKTNSSAMVQEKDYEELSSSPLTQDAFVQAKETYQLWVIDEATATKLSSQAKTIVQQAMQEGPEGLKNRVVIKNIGIDMPKSKLLQKKMALLTESTDESHARAWKLLTDLWKSVEQEMGVMIPGKTKPIRWVSKYIPFIGSKLENRLLNKEKVTLFLEGLQKGLEKTEKELKDQITELDTQKAFLKEDAQKLLEDFYLVQFIGQEIEQEIKNLTNGDKSMDMVIYRDEVNKNLLMPVLQKALAIGERIAVDHNYYLTLSALQQTAGNLIVAIQKADQVTMHALQNALAAQIALIRQQEIQSWIDKLNTITWDLIKTTSETIAKQSKEVAESTLKTGLNMEDLKSSIDTIKKAITEVNQVYQNALPEFQKNIETLQTIVAEGDKLLDVSEEALQLKKNLISE